MDRVIIKIYGTDAETFLHNLISNDLRLIKENQPIYSCLLSPRGRYQFDFFIIKKEDYFLIDIQESQADKFLHTLKYRKLIAKVDFEILKDLKIYNTKSEVKNSLISFRDPRLHILGFRTISQIEPSKEKLLLNYKELRFKNTIPESDDFTFDKSIPIEFGMDELSALNYTKGCYMGQEFTNSAKNKMVIRKRVITISSSFNLSKGDILTNKDNLKVGEVISSIGNLAMALFTMSSKDDDIFINEKRVEKHIPSWIKIYSTE